MTKSLLDLYADLDRQSTTKHEPDGPKGRDSYLKAPFAWAGAKSRSLDDLLPLLPYRKVWVDVFGGSGTVTLARNASPLDVYNDRYSGVTDFYRVIRNQELRQQLVEKLQLSLHSREEWVRCFEGWKQSTDPVERAFQWYYMMLYSFGTMGRNFGRSLDGSVNLPQKARNKIPLLQDVATRMANVQIENLDFRQILNDYDSEETVFYCDPPYLDSYSAFSLTMTYQDHVDFLNMVQSRKGFVAVSHYPHSLYESYDWDDTFEWESYVSLRRANSREIPTDGSRTSAIEKLYVKEAVNAE